MDRRTTKPSTDNKDSGGESRFPGQLIETSESELLFAAVSVKSDDGSLNLEVVCRAYLLLPTSASLPVSHVSTWELLDAGQQEVKPLCSLLHYLSSPFKCCVRLGVRQPSGFDPTTRPRQMLVESIAAPATVYPQPL